MGNAVGTDLGCGCKGGSVDCGKVGKNLPSCEAGEVVMGTSLCSKGSSPGGIDDPVVKESMLNHELLKAARDGRTADVELQIWNGAYLETRRPFAITFDFENLKGHESLGLTPLMYASLGGSTSTCEVLLKAKANVDAKDEDGMHPLHFAASSGNIETCRMLLRYNADPGILDLEGRTALEHVQAIDIHSRAERQAWEAIIGPNAPRPAPRRPATLLTKEERAPERTPEMVPAEPAGGKTQEKGKEKMDLLRDVQSSAPGCEEMMPLVLEEEKQGQGL